MTESTCTSVQYKTSPSRAWGVALGAFFGQMLLVFAMKNVYVALGTIASDFHVTVADIGIWASVLGLFYGVSGILWGVFIDKFGPRKVMVIDAFLTAALVVAIGAFVDNIVSGCVFMALLGIMFAGADDAVIPKLITSWFAPSKRGLGFPLVTLGGSLGGVLCGILAGAFVANYGWRMDFYIMGGICFVLAILLALLIRDSPASVGTVPFGSPEGTPVGEVEYGKRKSEEQKAEDRKRLYEVLRNPRTYAFGVVMIVWYFWYSTYTAYLVAAAEAVGFGVQTAALTTSMASLGCAIGFFIWPPMTNKVGRKPIFIFLMIAEGIMTFVLYGVLCSGNNSAAILLGTTLLMGIFISSAPVMQNSLGEQFKPSVRGTGSGAAATISSIGRLGGPVLAGLFITWLGSTQSYLIFSGASAILTGILVIFLVKPTGGKWGDPMAELEKKEEAEKGAKTDGD